MGLVSRLTGKGGLMFKMTREVGLISRIRETVGLLSEMMRREFLGSFGVQAPRGLAEAAW